MKRYVCVREEQILLLSNEEITQHLLKGQMFDEIFEVGREMELQIRLVPSKSAKKNISKTAPEADVAEEKEPEVEAANGVARKGRRKKASQTEASA